MGPTLIIGGSGAYVIPYWDNCHLGGNTKQGNLEGKRQKDGRLAYGDTFCSIALE